MKSNMKHPSPHQKYIFIYIEYIFHLPIMWVVENETKSETGFVRFMIKNILKILC